MRLPSGATMAVMTVIKSLVRHPRLQARRTPRAPLLMFRHGVPAPLLLRAVDPFLHGSVREALGFDDFAVAEAVRIGLGCGFSEGGDYGEDDHDIVVGEESAGRYCEVLLRQLPE